MDIFWGGVDDNGIARTVLSYIPDAFSGNLLDVPVGTGVFTAAKYAEMDGADITRPWYCTQTEPKHLERSDCAIRRPAGPGI